ncbi:deoxyribodipyrimidine photo-lyase isoform X1 [Huso huso]|uniref:Deoxyribodipyrimidine photo-lyase n=1 Tax=Huso huso TaxID=61971 RepID=A0ABR0Z289_HUSHU
MLHSGLSLLQTHRIFPRCNAVSRGQVTHSFFAPCGCASMAEKPGKPRKTKDENGNAGKRDQKVVEGGRQAGSSSGREAKAARKQEPGKRETTLWGSSGDELSNTGARKKRRLGGGDAVTSPPGGGGLASSIKESRLQAGPSVKGFEFNKKRVRLISEAVEMKDGSEGIVYWMSRDQRVQDNWALLYAQHLALSHELPLHVCFCLVPRFLDATIRHFGFMLRGLEEVAKECAELNISFHLLTGYAKDVLPEFVRMRGAGGVVTDFSPLRVPLQWVQDVKERLPRDVLLVQVDAHNIVPCWVASEKQEYGARTIRKKIHDKLSEYLTEFPPVLRHPHGAGCEVEAVDWEQARSSLEVDRSVKEVDWARPGTEEGLVMLESFIKERLKLFGSERNNPNRPALSNLSPWFHFGQVSVQRAVLEVRKCGSKHWQSVHSFVEEAVVRRELADNFCYYNKNYDRVEGASDWARKTLQDHAQDERSHLYSRAQLEEGKTHDPLWNAAQLQMALEGKMHGFLRMYWAKKILEWTSCPEEALETALYLNDRYELDGRDPNGYVGCMWSICGIHDQGWGERPVFGKIRFMNYAGCKRKFDVGQFERKYHPEKFTV